MKSFIIVLSIVTFNLQHLFGQGSPANFAIGIDLTPKMMYRSAWLDQAFLSRGDIAMNIYYRDLLDDEHPAFGFNVGVPVVWHRDSVRSLETGFYYSQRGFGWYDDYYRFSAAICEANGRALFHFLDIPVLYGRHIYHGRSFRIYGKIGPIFNILIQSKEVSEISCPSGTLRSVQSINTYDDLKDLEYRRANLSASFIIGTLIPLTNRLGLRIEPISSFMLNPVPKSGDIKRRYWEFGLRMGTFIKL